MGNVKTIAEFFLVAVSLGLALFSIIANSNLTGHGFIKLISNIGLALLAVLLIITMTSQSIPNVNLKLSLILTSMVSFLSASINKKEGRTLFTWAIYLLNSISLLWLVLLYSNFGSLGYLFLLSSAGLLGIITYGMILGHWYLVVPKLSERPLLIVSIILWIVLGLKIPLSINSMVLHKEFFEEFTTLGSGYAFNLVLLTMRLSFGYLVILVMSFFNWRLLKLRSIQSSTGVMYAMTFFVFIGELISTYLFFNYGMYI